MLAHPMPSGNHGWMMSVGRPLSPGPIEQRPQASLEAVLTGLDQASTERLRESREGSGADLGGGEFEIDLRLGRGFAKRVAENEVVDRRQQRQLLFIGQ